MSKQIAVALFALAVLVGATIAADSVVSAAPEPVAEFTEDVEVTSGTWYCMPLVRESEDATLSIAAVGDEPAQVTVERFAGGESAFDDPISLDPRAVHEIEVEGGELPPAFVVRWRGAPVVATWRIDGRAQRMGASCAESPAPRWMLPGADTTVGSATQLYLFNPFESDAVARVAFATPEGRQDLVSTENVSVPARSVTTLSVNELQPEQPDLAVIVEVEAGRVIAGGVQRFGQPELSDVDLEGAEPLTDPSAPEGRTVLPATSRTSQRVGLAYAASGESSTAWLMVTNPGEQPATVSVDVTDAIEGSVLDQQITVGPGSVERVDLSGVSSAPAFGVTVTSDNGAPIAANGFLAMTGERKSVTAAPAVTEADAMNAQAVVPEDAGAQIALYNPGRTEATATVSVGGNAPDPWSSITLPAGAMQVLPFADAGVEGGGPIEASADQPIYATVRLSGPRDEAVRLLTLPLVPANTWQGSAQAPRPQRDRTLDTRPVDFPAQPDR